MALTKHVLITSLFITLFLLSTMLLIGRMMNEQREDVVNAQIDRLHADLAEIQSFFLLSETYGDEMACLAFEQKLRDLDSSIWDLGIRLDQYRAASEEFTRSKFYLDQKRIFNENQMVYMTLLTSLKDRCDYDQTILAFFYTNSSVCDKCDDQAHVLTAVNLRMDQDVAIFSYDLELGITSIDLLARYYNVDELPCTVVEGIPYCGIHSRAQIMEAICVTSRSDHCIPYTDRPREETFEDVVPA